MVKRHTVRRIKKQKRKTQRGGTIKEWCDALGRCFGIGTAPPPAVPNRSANRATANYAAANAATFTPEEEAELLEELEALGAEVKPVASLSEEEEAELNALDHQVIPLSEAEEAAAFAELEAQVAAEMAPVLRHRQRGGGGGQRPYMEIHNETDINVAFYKKVIKKTRSKGLYERVIRTLSRRNNKRIEDLKNHYIAYRKKPVEKQSATELRVIIRISNRLQLIKNKLDAFGERVARM
jgi:hypothetical protein